MFHVVFNHPCEDFDKNDMLNLYVIFRMFSIIKYLNKKLLSQRTLKKEN